MCYITVLLMFLVCVSYECYAQSLFDFSVKNLEGESVSLKTYESAKVILVVNVASQCGYTRGHYKELKDMYGRLKPKGLEIFGKNFSLNCSICASLLVSPLDSL